MHCQVTLSPCGKKLIFLKKQRRNCQEALFEPLCQDLGIFKTEFPFTFQRCSAWVEVHQLHCLVVASRRNQISPALIITIINHHPLSNKSIQSSSYHHSSHHHLGLQARQYIEPLWCLVRLNITVGWYVVWPSLKKDMI